MYKRKLFAVILVINLILIAGCKKDEAPPVNVITTVISDITSISATGGGTVDISGNATVSARGVCWGINHSPTNVSNKTTDGSGSGTFTSSLTGLISSTTYYVRAYATVGSTSYYGNEVSLTTTDATELIQNGDFSTPSSGDESIASAVPWKTDETTDNSDPIGVLDWIGQTYVEYKGHTGFVWYYDWSKSLYQTVGMVPSAETNYQISFDNTCTWNAWSDYVQITAVIFSAYSGDDPTTRVSIDTVRIEEPIFPGWDLNTWSTKTGTYTLTEAKAAANAGKKLVIEFDALHYDDGLYFSDVWYDIDNISVKQSSAK
jgi:hypothetical protein